MKSIDFESIAPEVVLRLLDEPQERTGNDWRYGRKGSLSVDVEKATFYDHEAKEGGGLLELIERKTGQSGIEWLRSNGYMQSVPAQPQSPTEYVYCDAEGQPVYKVVRRHASDGKRNFSQCRFNGGRWVSGLKEVERLPYHLPDIASRPNDTIYVVEGEKDADNLKAHGLLATCNSGGAGNFRTDIAPYFEGRDVVVIPDNDEAGKDHADKVIEALSDVANSIKLLDLCKHWPTMPPKGDVSDFLNAGGTVEELQEYASETNESGSSKPLLFDIEQAKARHLLEVEPPPRRYVVQGFLPEPVAAGISAPGGVGKSFWLMQLSFSVASGRNFFGMPVAEPGGVMMLAAEDDTDELARRLHAIESSSPSCSAAEREALAENFYPVSRLAADNRITRKVNGVIEWNHELIAQIVRTAKAIPKLRLIILDPVSRFRSGDENASEDATKFVEAMEIIRRDTGVTVLCAHHSRKGSSGESQDDIRGASAFVDALRFAATLYVPLPEMATKLGIPEEERRSWVRLSVVKSNYQTTVDEMWLRRGAGGVLALTEAPKGATGTTAEQKAETRYQTALPTLRRVIQRAEDSSKPLTCTAITANHSGSLGLFKMGDKSLRAVISRAIDEGIVFYAADNTLTVDEGLAAIDGEAA